MNDYLLAIFISLGIILFTQGLKKQLRKSMVRTARNK